jgi:8-oxo-dGTP diphosphatase
MTYVIIFAKYKNKWIVVREKGQNTWTVPAGHIEENETLNQAASRELFEETGAIHYDLFQVNAYSVKEKEKAIAYGQIYFAQINELGELPAYEIEEIKFLETLDFPSLNWAYPYIQKKLAERIFEFIK